MNSYLLDALDVNVSRVVTAVKTETEDLADLTPDLDEDGAGRTFCNESRLRERPASIQPLLHKLTMDVSSTYLR